MNDCVPSIGIDDPAPAARAARLAELLAEDAVAGKGRAEHVAQTLLGAAVGDRDRAAVRLHLDGEPRPEVTEREAAGLLGGAPCHRQLVGVVRGHGRAA